MTGRDRKAYTLKELAARFGGEVLGDAGTSVSAVATLAGAGPGTISFLSNERYARQLAETRASAVILGPSARDAVSLPRIISSNPYALFARVSGLLHPAPPAQAGVDPTAVVHASATIAADAEIGPLAVVGAGAHIGARVRIGAGCHVGAGTRVGADTRLHAGVTIYERCTLGQRVIVHSGVVIGADGFGIALEDERWLKVPQIGGVTIGDDVEIGANTTIDRGAIEDTVIEEGVKLDNQIQVGHNVRIGAHSAIAACVGIAGSARIGRHCQIGGAAGLAGHIVIADHVVISGYTAVTKSIEQPGVYSGLYPFETNREWRRNALQIKRLAELARRVKALEAALGAKERSRS